ncbi:hypothetical protein OG194_14820 [Streptomyces sp. NBC_01288]|uniref:hypothetical protein n=1 Tax=Streptomyces sp. NBC_01288 TaxID=2903814 RepID=UPI002E0D5190|nr:hypothetical protein OG194_14820 [Streptomyces sp. NBC_01288]
MEFWEGMAWGAFGGFAMEALDYITAVRRWRRLPWSVGASTLTPDRMVAPNHHGHQPPIELAAPGLLAYTIAGTLRIAIGAGLSATVVSTSPQTASAWIAVLTGATAPLVLEKVTVLVPLVIHGDKSVPLQQVDGSPTGPEQQPGNLPARSNTAAGQTTSAPKGD